MEPTPFTAIARVVKAHGLAGELSCTEFEGPLDELAPGLEVWFVPPPDGARSGRLRSVRPGPKGVLATVDGVDSIDEARALQGTLMLAPTAELPSGWVSEDEPNYVGLSVNDVERGYLGEVADVIVTGANDVWVLHNGPFGEVLLPVIDDGVLSVDEEEHAATVRLLPGLLGEE